MISFSWDNNGFLIMNFCSHALMIGNMGKHRFLPTLGVMRKNRGEEVGFYLSTTNFLPSQTYIPGERCLPSAFCP